MDEQRKEAWRKCLILWEALSNKPTVNLESYNSSKREMIEKLGFEKQFMDCPLCEIYYDHYRCTLCPIKAKLNHEDGEVPCKNSNCPYSQYSDMIMYQNIHNEKIAKLFYLWLIDLAKKEGYEPDFNLKYW